jgi:hypothetical protein
MYEWSSFSTAFPAFDVIIRVHFRFYFYTYLKFIANGFAFIAVI